MVGILEQGGKGGNGKIANLLTLGMAASGRKEGLVWGWEDRVGSIIDKLQNVQLIMMMEPEKDEKEPTQDQILQLLQRKEKTLKLPEESSKASEEYLSFFEDIKGDQLGNETLLQKLKRSKIKYDSEKEASYYCIRIIKSTYNNELITLEVCLGPFILLLNLFNCSTKNYTHFLQGKTSTFATIYNFIADSTQAIIKCTTFKPKDFLDTLIVVLKEYSFLKIAAALEVGPQITPIFGFDLLAFEDCIQFSMERCEPLQVIDENIVKILKQKLLRFHTLKILHIDIKPQNFCFSPSLNQPVFIDFGLSQVLRQSPGESTQTSFMGSLSYCSPQMTKLYYSSSTGPIDFYLNDIICMKKSFVQMMQLKKKEQKVNFLREKVVDESVSDDEDGEIDAFPSSTESKKVAINFTLMKIKNYIFSQEPIRNWYQSYEQNMIKLKENVLDFIENLTYSEFLDELCCRLMSYNKLDRFLCYNFVNRLKKKGELFKPNKIPTFEESNDNETSTATLRMSEIGSNLIIKSINLAKKEIQPQINIHVFLQTPQLVFRADRDIIFNKFMQFSDLRTSITSNPKRLKIAKLLINHLKLTEPPKPNDRLCLCWRHILNNQLLSPSLFYLQNITIAVHNLMIVQDFSIDEYCRTFVCIGQLPIKNIRKAQLLYMCGTSSLWEFNRFFSKYDYFEFREKFIATINQQFSKLDDIPKQLTVMLIFLIFLYTENTNTPSSNILVQLQAMSHLLTFQVYCDIRKNIISSIMKSSLKTSQKQLYQLINSQGVDRFNYHYFSIFSVCSRLRYHSIANNIFHFIEKCLQGTDLLLNFKIYYDMTVKKQQETKIPNKEYYFRLLSSELKVENIYNSYNSIIALSSFFSIDFPQNSSLQIREKASLLINDDFMESLINSHRKVPLLGIIYEIYYHCTKIYIQLHKNQPSFEQKLETLIEQFIQKWDKQNEQVRRETILSICGIIGKGLSLSNKIENAILLEMTISNRYYSILSFQQISYLLKNICSLIYLQKDMNRPQQYFDFIISGMKYLNNPSQYVLLQTLQILPDLNHHLLITRNNCTQFIDLHLTVWSELQRNPQSLLINTYFRSNFEIVVKHREKSCELMERIKLLPRESLRECEKYSCACILMIFLVLEKKYEAVSRRILILICNTLPRIKLYPKAVITNTLYNYLINNEASILDPKRAKIQVPFQQILLQSASYRTRKVLYWARRLIKFTSIRPNEVRAYCSFFVSKFDKASPYHLRLENFLRRSYTGHRINDIYKA